MPDTATDTSDLRALARVILDQEDLEQAAMRPSRPAVRPRSRSAVSVVKGLRVGSLLGVTLGLASSGAGTATTFRQPGVGRRPSCSLTVAGTALGAAVGAAAGSRHALVAAPPARP